MFLSKRFVRFVTQSAKIPAWVFIAIDGFFSDCWIDVN